jgi:poly-gamma-glutamate synthesis protein (capsule biosynthesis protein)
MTGRGIDQILPHSSSPELQEPRVGSALAYVDLAERAHGPLPRRVDFSYVWGEALACLDERRPVARIINLETSITTSAVPEPKWINYRMHPGNAPVLTAARIDCCVLANNHVLDWGVAGLLETVDVLRGEGINTVGAGGDAAEAEAPAVLMRDGAPRVLVFAFGATDSGIARQWGARADRPGVNLLDDLSERTVARIAQLVESTRLPNDLAVASIHWGGNWGYEIPSAHRRFAHALIDRAGVNVIHGHSSHHPKAIEVYQNRPIFYGCGDFLDDYEGISGYEEFRDDLVLMYFPTLDFVTGDLVELAMTPLQIRNFRLQRPPAADRAWLHARLEAQCRRFGHGIGTQDDDWILQ